MGRTLTPERQKLKDQAISLRYDWLFSEREIADQLNLGKTTIHDYVVGNSHLRAVGNNGRIKHFEGDCLEILPTLPDKSIDVLLTDPPYSVMDDYEWDKKDDEFYHQWLTALKPKLKDKHTGYIFFDSRRMYEFEGILRQYFPIRNRIIWIRRNMSMGRVIKSNYISSYEIIFYFGTRDLNLPVIWGPERFDVWNSGTLEFAVPQSNYSDKKLHPTQKPFNLIQQLLKVGSYPGDIVLDCFAGSGVTGKVCKLTDDLKCILIELDPRYNEIIRNQTNGRDN